jgi:SAM-dependent methyltransferase
MSVQIISHNTLSVTSFESEEIRIQALAHPTLPVEEELSMLRELSQFDLGRFLLESKGLNGHWTAYLILEAPKKVLNNSLEQWLVHKAPAVVATRERFSIFQREIQKLSQPGASFASIPCGTMDDLLTLETTELKLVGIDFDPKSTEEAQSKAVTFGKAAQCRFQVKDAWNLQIHEEFDLVTSNGLNIYEPDDNRVIELYRQFCNALKPGGTLVTSFLTPPSVWKNYSKDDALKQKALFGDVIQAKWQTKFRFDAETRAQLQAAGFTDITVIEDSQGIFPTVVAKK